MNGHFIISRKVHKNLMQAYANFKFADVEGQDQEKMDFISAMEDLKEEAAWVARQKHKVPTKAKIILPVV